MLIISSPQVQQQRAALWRSNGHRWYQQEVDRTEGYINTKGGQGPAGFGPPELKTLLGLMPRWVSVRGRQGWSCDQTCDHADAVRAVAMQNSTGTTALGGTGGGYAVSSLSEIDAALGTGEAEAALKVRAR
jgi:hypothetical protein